MNQEEYVEKRVEDQIKWYSKKSRGYQAKYKRWQVIKVIVALIIPLLVFWIEKYPFIKYIVSALSVFIAFIESYTRIYNFKELWMTYRATSENLKREKIFFLTKVAPYNNEKPFELFVTNSEQIMKNENAAWRSIIDQKNKDD